MRHEVVAAGLRKRIEDWPDELVAVHLRAWDDLLAALPEQNEEAQRIRDALAEEVSLRSFAANVASTPRGNQGWFLGDFREQFRRRWPLVKHESNPAQPPGGLPAGSPGALRDQATVPRPP